MKIKAIFGTLLLISIAVLSACSSGAATPLPGSNGGAPSSDESGSGAPSGGTTSSGITSGGSSTSSGDGGEASNTDAPELRRMVKITAIEGTVEVMANGSAEFAPAEVGQELREGDEVRTGADGRVTLMLDDGTAAIVTENASLKVTTISGTHDSPITRFFMSVGEIITVHEGELPDDAAYEIETPDGVAAIRGSSLVVRYDPVTGKMTAACLTGTCLIQQPDGEPIQIDPGQVVEIQEDRTVSEPRDISPDEQELWDGVIITCDCQFDPAWFWDDYYNNPNDNQNPNDNSVDGGSDSGTDGNDDSSADSGGTDSGTDISGDDTGGTDEGTTDTSGTDSGGTDHSGTDTGSDDTGGTDEGTTDTGGTDDSGTTDSGGDDSGTDTSGTDSGTDTTGAGTDG